MNARGVIILSAALALAVYLFRAPIGRGGAAVVKAVRNLSAAGAEFIKAREGLELKPYRDIAGHWTIGYGRLLTPEEAERYAAGITREEADRFFAFDVERKAADPVRRLVRVPLTQGQFDALTSFVFNFGETKFANSTLLKLLNQGFYAAAAEQFLVWNKATVGGVLQPVRGLTLRREAERKMFLS